VVVCVAGGVVGTTRVTVGGETEMWVLWLTRGELVALCDVGTVRTVGLRGGSGVNEETCEPSTARKEALRVLTSCSSLLTTDLSKHSALVLRSLSPVTLPLSRRCFSAITELRCNLFLASFSSRRIWLITSFLACESVRDNRSKRTFWRLREKTLH